MAGNTTKVVLQETKLYITCTTTPLTQAVAERQLAIHIAIDPTQVTEAQVKQLLTEALKRLRGNGNVGS